MKPVLKHIITSLTLACFLLATNGLSLVEHYCSSQKTSHVFWFTQNPGCGNCAEHHEESCCEHEQCEHTEPSDCCQNTNKFLKLIADYFSSSNDTHTDCPFFIVETHFDIEKTALSVLSMSYMDAFSEDVGLSEQLLIKRTTEFLL